MVVKAPPPALVSGRIHVKNQFWLVLKGNHQIMVTNPSQARLHDLMISLQKRSETLEIVNLANKEDGE